MSKFDGASPVSMTTAMYALPLSLILAKLALPVSETPARHNLASINDTGNSCITVAVDTSEVCQDTGYLIPNLFFTDSFYTKFILYLFILY